ncbi:hypothetical protein GXW82_33790 [Streptacidiphilus sp. 4-A2]|nr:hypothetical protein [Streptacidiphilus sp. 4-A2]
MGIIVTIDFSVPPGTQDSPTLGRVYEAVKPAAATARALVKRYLDLASIVSSQHWLTTQSQTPQIMWMTFVYDEDGNRVNISFGDPDGRVLMILPNEKAIDSGRQDELIRLVQADAEMPIADSFLRDAKYLGMQGRDPAQTLIFAAIACELKIKAALVDLADSRQRDLVDLMIGKSREFALAVSALYDKGIRAVAGKSMKDDERELYKLVVKLFEDRNVIAHRGESPPMDVVRNHVQTAELAFAWINQLASSIES